jgi:hypothetical protein
MIKGLNVGMTELENDRINLARYGKSNEKV